MISSTDISVAYTTDGSKVSFPFTFAAIDADDITVSLDGTASLSGWTATLNADPDTGGTVTFTTAPTENQTLVISRVTPVTQLTDFTAGSELNAETLENAFDKLTLIAQEYQGNLDRAVKLPAGTTTNAQITTSMYGRYLGLDANGNIVSLAGTLVSEGGGGDYDYANASDVDVISVAATGTTTITIPDSDTPVFGAVVTSDVGAGSYTHNIDLPTPGSAGMRGFIRVTFSTAHEAVIILRDHNDTNLVVNNGARGNYATDIRVVSTGSAWTIEDVRRGEVGQDQFVGAVYVLPEDESDATIAVSDLATAASDSGNAVIVLNADVVFDDGDSVTIPERHKLVFGKGGRLSMSNTFVSGGSYARIDCEILTAFEDQVIFKDCQPGAVFGKFGGLSRNAAWWDVVGTIPAIAEPYDDTQLQSALVAADWDTTDGTAVTVTNWNDGTNVITVADTAAFRDGDVVIFSGTLGANLIAGKPYVVRDATNGTGDTLSTFKLAHSRFQDALDFGTGGSLAATLTRAKSLSSFRVNLRQKTYTVQRPLALMGSGAHVDGRWALIQAQASSDWTSHAVTHPSFDANGGHAPMILLGEATPGEWSGLSCSVQRLTLDGNDRPMLSGYSSTGHIHKGSRLEDITVYGMERTYLSWSYEHAAIPGLAATTDLSELHVSRFSFTGIAAQDAEEPYPVRCPGSKVTLEHGHIDAGGEDYAIVSGNRGVLTLRSITYEDATYLLGMLSNSASLRCVMYDCVGEEVGAGDWLVLWGSTQTDARLTMIGCGAIGNDQLLKDGTSPVSARDLEVGWVDFLAWSNNRMTSIADGIVRTTAVALHESPSQVTEIAEDDEILLTSFTINDGGTGQALVLKYDDGGTTQWKYLKGYGAGDTWTRTTTDPEA